MSFEDTLPITNADVYEQVKTSDGAGGKVLTWTKIISNYKCRIYSAMGMIQITQSGQNVLRTHKGLGEYNSLISDGMMLVANSESFRMALVDKVYNRDSIHHLEFNLKKENFNYV
jgi:hypothetical protein